MKITDLLKKNKDEITFSVEITPPKRGNSIDKIFKVVEALMPHNPLWIDVTSHSAVEEFSQDQESNNYKKKVTRKSPGTIAVCAAIAHRFDIPTVPHLLCNGFTREETEDSLIDLHYLGINNVLCIRGDGRPKKLLGGRTINKNAWNLAQQVSEMNLGQYLDLGISTPTDFCVGVGCYPEKHFEAPNLEWDIEALQIKFDWSHYAVTQMFFDNQKFYSFLDFTKKVILGDCDKNAGLPPIIPGLKIMTKCRQLETIPKRFFVDFTSDFAEEMVKASEESLLKEREVGINWAVSQCQDLIKHGHNHLHFYVLQNVEPFLDVWNRVKNEGN